MTLLTPSEDYLEKRPLKNRKLHIHQVDAFTKIPFKGCPSTVILGAEGLNDETLESIAKEMAPSNIAYLFPSEKSDFSLRFFTQEGEEINFCVSSALAALSAVSLYGPFGVKPGKSYPFKIESNGSVTPFHVELKRKNHAQITYDLPSINLASLNERADQIALRLGLPTHLLSSEHLPMVEARTGHLYLPTPSLEALAELDFDTKFALPYLREKNLSTVSFITPETFEKGNHAHIRSWAPWLSTDERSFLGATQGGIAYYLYKNSWIKKNPKTLVLEQGDFLDRPGRAKVHVQKEKEQAHAQIQTDTYHLYDSILELEL